MVPHTKAETEIYKPLTLANLADPPTFTFRPATFRDKRAFSRATMVEGLTIHSTEAIRQALRSELKRLWSDDVRDQQLARLENFWATSDQNEKAAPADQITISIEDQEAYLDLMKRVLEASPLLRSMQADNADFYAIAPKLALGQFLTGWRGLVLPFRREGGTVSLETLTDLEQELFGIEKAAIADNIAGVGQPGTAFDLLAAHALTLLGLTAAEESKSASPSQSSTSPAPSTPTSNPLTAGGKSPGGRASKKTPAV